VAHAYAETPKPKGKAGSPCPAPEPPATDTCCDLICFERPNYFCGHLLTDEDLKLEQRYVREKNKLYHRALHGHGIVCGLGLTCDPHCKGHVVAGEGFAIDDCGNDLVVCEPRSFDVVGCLKDKGWLVEPDPVDPCLPPRKTPDCEVPQCFYVVACYEETTGEYTTPFVAGCLPALSGCEPTRVREGVRFDVVREAPKAAGPLPGLGARLERPFALFTRGEFARVLNGQDNRLLLGRVLGLQASAEDHDRLCTLFCQLREFLKLYLKRSPDPYDCDLKSEVDGLVCPDPGNDREGYPGRVRDAFCALLNLARRTAINRYLGEIVPRCAGPPHASCVTLGKVEVVSGRLTRVCNCHRTYVWSSANFFEVLHAYLHEAWACGGGQGQSEHPGGEGHGPQEGEGCCGEFALDCEDFIKQVAVNPEAPREAGLAPARALIALAKSVQNAFNPVRSRAFAPRIVDHMAVQDAMIALRGLGVEPEQVETKDPGAAQPPTVIDILQRIGLTSPGDRVLLSTSRDRVLDAFIDRRPVASLSDEERGRIEGKIKEAEDAAKAAADDAAKPMDARINDLAVKLNGILTDLDTIKAKLKLR
jgi:hypothetical protein